VTDKWRFALLADRINEVFALARAVNVPRYGVLDPRSKAALSTPWPDPFAHAVWSLDQALSLDLPGALADAEYYTELAEREVIAHRQRMRRRQTPRYRQVHARICGLHDLEARFCSSLWEGGVQVRELPFDGELVEGFIKKAIRYFEDDGDPDAAERCCETAERLMTGGGP